jgi:hypothetical protein
MSGRHSVCLIAFWLGAIAPALAQPAGTMDHNELIAKLQRDGYANVRDITTTREGTAVKATKNGREVSLIVDSGGQVREAP